MRWSGSGVEALEPLEAEGQVRAALRAGDGMHLVHDRDPNGLQELPGARGEHEEERLRRRDQDVGRVPEHRRALLRRRVARADAHGELRADAGERPAQVALDVVVERLERAHVEHLRAFPGRARSRAQRNAASVLPEPVGAWMRTFLPEAIAGQPSSCAGVGASNVRSNHPRTAGLKGASGLTSSAYREARAYGRAREASLFDGVRPSHLPLRA